MLFAVAAEFAGDIAAKIVEGVAFEEIEGGIDQGEAASAAEQIAFAGCIPAAVRRVDELIKLAKLIMRKGLHSKIIRRRCPSVKPNRKKPRHVRIRTSEHNRNKRIGGAAMRGNERLIDAACVTGCDPCFRRCALARIHLAWWEREEERLLRERACRAGPNRAQWMAELAEAQECVRRFRQETRLSAPNFPGAAWPAGFPGSPARARLH